MKDVIKKSTTQLQKGFTIIEVMIVLAIAGLILVVVLIAVPQLQSNQRDSTRQSVVSRVATELGSYSGNNNGAYPFTNDASLDDFVGRYITDEVDIANPSTGNQYDLVFSGTGSTGDIQQPTADQILVHRGASCDGEFASGSVSTGNIREFALRVALEAGDVYYCVDNN